MRRHIEELMNEAYIYNVIVEQHPHAMTFDNADIVPTAQSTATVNHHRYQVIHSVRVACVIRLHHTKQHKDACTNLPVLNT